MAARSGTVDRRRAGRSSFLPSGTGVFLRRRADELLSLLLVAVAAALVIALITHDPRDPSLNRAVDGPIGNLLGWPGAYISDLSLNGLGLAIVLVPVILAGWAWRLWQTRGATEGKRRWPLRLAAVPALLLLAAIAFAVLPKPAIWPLGTGLGGFVGTLGAARAMAWTGLDLWLIGLSAALLASLAFAYSAGLSTAEWAAAGRAALRPLAWGIAMLGRGARLAWDTLRDAARDGQRVVRRREPRLGESPPWLDGDESDEVGEGLEDSGAFEDTEDPPLPPARARADERKRRKPCVAAPQGRPKAGRRGRLAGQGRLNFGASGGYELPPLSLLKAPTQGPNEASLNRDALEKNARLLESVLQDFGVRGEIVKVRPGPVVTSYELDPAPGTKTSRVVGLSDDIARSMSAIAVRVAVVPGSSTIGVELPNAQRETVLLRELLASRVYERTEASLPLVLGKDIGGAPMIVDLARMPHLLVAGTTGSGKSVGLNSMILSLLYRLGPDRCKFIMIDPKMLELSVYDGVPHLLAPVVTEPKKAVVALKWTVREMEDRYRAMSRLGVRNIGGYNARIEEALKTGEVLTRRVQTGFDPDTGQPLFEEQPFDLEPLPFIVVVVDEMADLMLVAGKDIEMTVQRLAQMARAAGIHLIMATQRPSVDVITGTIKANFPTRISFHVTSKIDSRTILGEMGAEQLLGQGDMLYMAHGGRIARVHGPFVSDQEVEEVAAFLKEQGQPAYIEGITEEDEPAFDALSGGGDGGDDLYDRAVAVVFQHRKCSTSFIQRQLQIGYNRAARLVERMEAEGVVSPANHVGKREVLPPGS